MKNYNLYPWIIAIIVVAGVVMNITQVPGANYAYLGSDRSNLCSKCTYKEIEQ